MRRCSRSKTLFATACSNFSNTMPCLDKPLDQLLTYTGTNPRPADFDAYWTEALEALEAVDPAPLLERNSSIATRSAEAFDLTFTGIGGARIYAKYLRPRASTRPHPAVLEFHGYTGNSGDWQDKLRFIAEGTAIAAMDCRGQGGKSEDTGAVPGTTHHGHIIRGLSGKPQDLLFRSIFLDTVQLARVVDSFDEVDSTRMASNGGSQGGALSIACAALSPHISRCVSVFPFLSDYKRVWEMDLLKDAYGELRTYLRHFDPLAIERERIFEKLGYIDVHHLAPRIRAAVVMALTLQDNICPPSTQFAVFNALTSPKTPVIYPDFGHENLPGFADRVFGFLTFQDA